MRKAYAERTDAYKKRAKTHLYNNNKRTQKGYTKTACGRDGYYVGGFIETLFITVHWRHRCKVCNKVFKKMLKKKPIKNFFKELRTK